MDKKELYLKWKASGLPTATKIDSSTPMFDVLAECTLALYSTNLCRTCNSAIFTYWKMVEKWFIQNAERNGWNIEETIEEVIEEIKEFKPKSYGKRKKK